MNWYNFSIKNAQVYRSTKAKKYLGYKIVGFDGARYFSLYRPDLTIDVTIGSVISPPGGLYLGTTKQFCIDYYSNGTDFQDALLTYEYDENDVLSGEPNASSGEVIVKRGKLKEVEIQK